MNATSVQDDPFSARAGPVQSTATAVSELTCFKPGLEQKAATAVRHPYAAPAQARCEAPD